VSEKCEKFKQNHKKNAAIQHAEHAASGGPVFDAEASIKIYGGEGGRTSFISTYD